MVKWRSDGRSWQVLQYRVFESDRDDDHNLKRIMSLLNTTEMVFGEFIFPYCIVVQILVNNIGTCFASSIMLLSSHFDIAITRERSSERERFFV